MFGRPQIVCGVPFLFPNHDVAYTATVITLPVLPCVYGLVLAQEAQACTWEPNQVGRQVSCACGAHY